MPYLTHHEIQNTYEFGQPARMMVVHRPDFWNTIQNYGLIDPVRLKFAPDIRAGMPGNIRRGKGIYMFMLEPNYHFPENAYIRQVLYIGRVIGGTTNYNFYRRFNEYVKAIGSRRVRLNYVRLANLWPDHTYVYYFDLSHETDQRIKDIEKNLIDGIIPPLNESMSAKAKRTRAL